MTEWKAKRFWKATQVEPAAGGYRVLLDGRAVKTPGKRELVVPTQAMAQAIAGEWDEQSEFVKPETMPCTRSANAAIDKVTDQFDEVATLLAAYGDSDLLCYRAASPESLVERQSKSWDPLLEWVATELGAPLETRTGVMHSPQGADTLSRFDSLVRAMSVFELTGFHDLVGLSGSLVLALAVVHGRLSPEQAWTLSRLDEIWQAELWGSDEEAEEQNKLKMKEFLHAARFFQMSKPR